MPKNPREKNIDNHLEGRIGLVYARVSSKKQEVEGNGLQSQEGRCKNQLKVLDVPYFRTFPDSYSGGGDFMSRPAMKELLSYIDENPHQRYVVVFDDLKRFSREVQFHFKLKAAFKARNVMLICLNYNFDESPEGQFAELIMAGQAELERHQNRRQVIQKQKARLENGYWAFNTKRGYTLEKSTGGRLSVPHFKDGALLEKALMGFASGKFIRKIDACKFLVENGFWDKQEPKKYVHRFSQFLTDPFYYGEIYYPQWGVSRRQGKHKPLISKKVFDLIQKRLFSGNLSTTIRIDLSKDFPLRGLIVCADCGKHLTAAWAKGRSNQYTYYFCQNKSCNSYRKSHPKNEVESRFMELLKSQSFTEKIDDVRKVFNELWNEELSTIKKKQDIEISKNEDFEDKITRITALIIEAKSDRLREVYERQMEILIAEKEDRGSILEIDDYLEKIYRTALNKALELLKKPYEIWTKLDVEEQQRLFFVLFEDKLPYHKKEGYRTAKVASNITLFEGLAIPSPLDVNIHQNTSNRVKKFLKKFWEFYDTSPSIKNIIK